MSEIIHILKTFTKSAARKIFFFPTPSRKPLLNKLAFVWMCSKFMLWKFFIVNKILCCGKVLCCMLLALNKRICFSSGCQSLKRVD